MSVINSQFTDVGSTGLVLKGVPCDASVYAGAAVYLSGGIAFNALADNETTSNIVGIVERKLSSAVCDIRVTGVSLAHFSGLDESKEYYLSATIAGAITTVVPITAGHIFLRIGQPFGGTKLVINKGMPVKRA